MDIENLQDRTFFVVDAINGNEVRCENIGTKESIIESLDKLPPEVKEGDVISSLNGVYQFEIDETRKRIATTTQLFNSLWE